jgi:ubiquinone/menaquinone biosynthesis C-methylase UbiE
MKTSVIASIDFRIMSLALKVRDLRRPRMKILQEASLKQGFNVLDYGCGPGSYIVPLAELVGGSGRIYALDANPLAVRVVEGLTAKKGLSNVQTILSDCDTGLPPASINVVLLYDILHDLKNRDMVLAELFRVLKPGGILSVSDHHLKQNEIMARATDNGLFTLLTKGENTISFLKVKQ